MLNQENIPSPIIQSRRNWFISFVMEVYLETMMERLNSGELKIIFRIIWKFVIIGRTKSGRAAWQEEKDTRKDFSIVLILKEHFCTSELSKVIQDAILLILPNRIMSWFRTVSSSTLIMSDVQSIYIPSSIRDWYLEVKIWATDWRCSFCLWIPWTKTTRILMRSTWMNRVMHNTCKKHGRTSKHGVLGRHQPWSEDRMEVLSNTIERHHSSRNTPSLLYPESCYDGIWRNHLRKSICVTSASSKDFLATWLDEGTGFRSCSTTRRRSCSTSKKFPTNPTKPKSKSW